MLPKETIFITGGIATGKTTLGRILAVKGAMLTEVDLICQEILSTKLGDRIYQALNVSPEGSRDEKRQAIFSSVENQKFLAENFLPLLRVKILEALKNKKGNFNVVIFPLWPFFCYEPYLKYSDRFILLTTDKDRLIERLKVRDGVSYDAAKKLINLFFSWQEKMRQVCDIHFNNSMGLDEMIDFADFLAKS